MQSNKVGYITASGLYCTKHDVKVYVCMPELSSSRIIEHRFHVENDKGESHIGYYMIIGRDLMLILGPAADFKHQVPQWYGAKVPLKEPSGMCVKSDLNKRDMREVVMHTLELASTREATEILVKILDSTYENADLKQVADNKTNLKRRTLLRRERRPTGRTTVNNHFQCGGGHGGRPLGILGGGTGGKGQQR